MRKIEFYKHNLSKKDKAECLKVLNSLFLTTGKVVEKFEDMFSVYLQSKFTVGVTSCTTALFLALKAIDIKEGDEVITTPLSFIATANVIEYCGAKPVFVDVEMQTGNIDADLIEKSITSKTKAIIPVHLYGQMCDMIKIKKIADKYNLRIVEDSAHCIEGERDGIKPGQLGDMACFSFYAIKNITSGEGGAIVCNNREIYQWLLKARLHGMSKGAADRYIKKYEHYDMEFLGYKFNMSNIQASLLLHQLGNIENFLSVKKKIAKKYDAAFAGNNGIRIHEVVSNVKHARHIYTILVNSKKRDEYLDRLGDVGIGVAVNFRTIPLMSYYRKKYGYKIGDFPIAEKIGASTITLPCYPKLKNSEIRYVIEAVSKIVR